MKKIVFAAALVTAVLLSGCWKDEIPARQHKQTSFSMNDTFVVNWQKKYCDTLNNVCITLDSILSDSRCPRLVDCIWQGNGEVRFIFNDGSTSHKIVLNTFGGIRFPKQTTIGKYTIEMLELMPYPIYPNMFIQQKDYSARISIRK